MPQEANKLGDSYESLLADLRSSIDQARREWAASLLCAYPERDALSVIAKAVCGNLLADGVEVNAIYGGRQITLATAPESAGGDVPMDSSLCVLTVGVGRPLAVSNIGDGWVGEHAAVGRGIGSWVSVPIVLHDEAAGSLCALQDEARQWTTKDEIILLGASSLISRSIESWLERN